MEITAEQAGSYQLWHSTHQIYALKGMSTHTQARYGYEDGRIPTSPKGVTVSVSTFKPTLYFWQ
jgi:hypothetical protein